MGGDLWDHGPWHSQPCEGYAGASPRRAGPGCGGWDGHVLPLVATTAGARSPTCAWCAVRSCPRPAYPQPAWGRTGILAWVLSCVSVGRAPDMFGVDQGCAECRLKAEEMRTASNQCQGHETREGHRSLPRVWEASSDGPYSTAINTIGPQAVKWRHEEDGSPGEEKGQLSKRFDTLVKTVVTEVSKPVTCGNSFDSRSPVAGGGRLWPSGETRVVGGDA